MHTSTGDAAAQESPPRGSFRLLIDPTFGPFMFGKVFSTAGIWIHNIAAAIVVYDLTRSATLVGAVSIAQFAPQLFLTPFFGALADRGNRRRQLIWGRLVTTFGSGLLAAWLWLTDIGGTAGAAAVIAAALIVGIGFTIGGPAMQALIPSLIRPSELPAAVALGTAPFTLARAGGPAIGAVIVTLAGPATAFAVAAASNLLFIAIVAVIRIRERPRIQSKDTSVRGGLRHVRSDRTVVLLLLGTAAAGFAVDPVITLSPPVADQLGGGPELVGALASTFGTGAALAFPTMGWLRQRAGLHLLGPAGLLIMASGFALLAIAPAANVALAATGLAGVGFTLGVIALSTLVQERAPEEFRGRVMSMWMIAFIGSRPFAAGIHGTIADLVSTSAALTVTVAVLVGGAWLVRPGQLERLPPGQTPEEARRVDPSVSAPDIGT